MEIDRVDKALDVAVAISFPLDRFHFGVHALGNGVGRVQIEVGQDPLQMIIEHLGHPVECLIFCATSISLLRHQQWTDFTTPESHISKHACRKDTIALEQDAVKAGQCGRDQVLMLFDEGFHGVAPGQFAVW